MTDDYQFPELTCVACGASKNIHFFSPSQRGKSHPRCMQCWSAHNRKRYVRSVVPAPVLVFGARMEGE